MASTDQNSAKGKAVAVVLSLLTALITVLKLPPGVVGFGLVAVAVAGAWVFVLLGFKKLVYGASAAALSGWLLGDITGGTLSSFDIVIGLVILSCVTAYRKA